MSASQSNKKNYTSEKDVYDFLREIFTDEYALTNGEKHVIDKIYKDKDGKMKVKYHDFNDIAIGTGLKIDEVLKNKIFTFNFTNDGETYNIESIVRNDNKLTITFKSTTKNSTSGFFGAFQKSKRYQNELSLLSTGGRRIKRHTVGYKKSRRTHGHKKSHRTRRHRQKKN